MNSGVSRRKFLTSAGLSLAVAVGPRGLRVFALGKADTPGEVLRPSTWFTVTPDNRIVFFMPKSEMGQGTHTALPMIVAEELEADWSRVVIENAPVREEYFDPAMGAQATWGSHSIRSFYHILRQAGAAGREMLLQAAAGKWKVPLTECRAVRSEVLHPPSKRHLSFGELCQQASQLPVPENPALKRKEDFKLMGTGVRRIDLPAKVQGKARFGIDVEVPGMLYGALARPSAYGARPVSFDEAAARAVEGVRFVGLIKRGVGVCAETLEAAWKGRDALRVKWDGGVRPDLNNAAVEREIAGGLDREGFVALRKGDADQALKTARQRVEAEYMLPYLSHTTMEPMNCTAHVQADRCDIWVPTQGQSNTVEQAAEITGLRPEQIHVDTTYLGGGFGRRGRKDFVEEAVALSKASGHPVKVQWSREEDMQHGLYRPGNACRIVGGLDDTGRLVAWTHKTAVSPLFSGPDRADRAAVQGLVDTQYEIPHILIRHVPVDLPIPVTVWRSVGHSQNGFTMESFMDEAAHAAGADPLDFRLRHLGHDRRARRVLETVAERAGWRQTLKRGQGRGIASHFSFETYVAEVAEVSVDEQTGKITVHRVVCAVDCGPMVNTDTIVAQMEGSIVMGLSALLKEQIAFADGGVESANFIDYPLLRMSEVPEIEVELVQSEGPVGGVGEPGLPPLAPAVTGAIFNATGIRLRKLPLTPKVVRAALARRRV